MISPVSKSLLNHDETVAATLDISKVGADTVSVLANATTATNFYLDVSVDGSNYFTFDSASSASTYKFSGSLAFPYVRVRFDTAGTSGTDTVNIILSAS